MSDNNVDSSKQGIEKPKGKLIDTEATRAKSNKNINSYNFLVNGGIKTSFPQHSPSKYRVFDKTSPSININRKPKQNQTTDLTILDDLETANTKTKRSGGFIYTANTPIINNLIQSSSSINHISNNLVLNNGLQTKPQSIKISKLLKPKIVKIDSNFENNDNEDLIQLSDDNDQPKLSTSRYFSSNKNLGFSPNILSDSGIQTKKSTNRISFGTEDELRDATYDPPMKKVQKMEPKPPNKPPHFPIIAYEIDSHPYPGCFELRIHAHIRKIFIVDNSNKEKFSIDCQNIKSIGIFDYRESESSSPSHSIAYFTMNGTPSSIMTIHGYLVDNKQFLFDQLKLVSKDVLKKGLPPFVKDSADKIILASKRLDKYEKPTIQPHTFYQSYPTEYRSKRTSMNSNGTGLYSTLRPLKPKKDEATKIEVPKFSLDYIQKSGIMFKYPFETTTDQTVVNWEDLSVLDPGQFLNDIIISFYIKYIYQHIPDLNVKNEVYIFSSYFYQQLTKKYPNNESNTEESSSRYFSNYQNIMKWTKNVNIFNYKYLFIPINEHLHWYMALIYNPAALLTLPIEPIDSVLIYSQEVDTTLQSSQNQSSYHIQESNQSIDIELTQNNESNTSNDPFELKPLKSRLSIVESLNSNDQSPNQLIESLESPLNEIQDEDIEILEFKKARHLSLIEKKSAQLEREELKKIEAQKKKAEQKKKTCASLKEFKIIMFDSLGHQRPKAVDVLYGYLVQEAKYKLNKEIPIKIPRKSINATVPTQPNFWDCGIFLLQYIETFLSNPERQLHCLFNKINNSKAWFSQEEISKKRIKIQTLMVDYADYYEKHQKLKNCLDECEMSVNSDDVIILE